MEVKAKLNYLRIAPRKVRLVADLIRGKSVKDAQALLNFSLKKAAFPLKKLLNSARENAKNNFHLDEDTLYISEIKVDEGPKLKRWRARARGRAAEIQKKSSHVTLVISGEKRKAEEKKMPLAGKKRREQKRKLLKKKK